MDESEEDVEDVRFDERYLGVLESMVDKKKKSQSATFCRHLMKFRERMPEQKRDYFEGDTYNMVWNIIKKADM